MNSGRASERAAFELGTALIAVAGCVDAIGFLRLNHLFVSFMSGNSTQLAIALVRGQHGKPGEVASIVALFVIGGVIGFALLRLAGAWGRSAVIALDAALLATAAALDRGNFASIIPVVLAMGVQNAAIRRVGETQTNLTYVTGTLVLMSQKIVDAFSGPRTAWLPYAIMWFSMIVGAALGAMLYGTFGLRALFLPAAAAAVLAILAWTEARATA
ncbi:MAG TPA: YoaK family protein [Candidatus Baltobacteraceae bacterium]|nr:YoaK family protein [Candidatus Baltobacteraceae bacterium]